MRIIAVLLLIAAALFALPAYGQDAARHMWFGWRTSIVEISPSDGGHFADILFINERSESGTLYPFQITYDGMVFEFLLISESGDNPDMLVVKPPPGFVAIPPNVNPRDGESAWIEIHYITMG